MTDAQGELDEVLSQVDLSSRARGRFKKAQALLAQICGLDPSQVYVTYVSGGSQNARNRARQAQTHHEVELLILDSAAAVDGSAGQVADFVEVGDLAAILLAVEDNEEFPVARLLVQEGNGLGQALGGAFPAANVQMIGTSSTEAELPAFAARDCELFERTGGKSWSDLADADKEHGKDVTARLKSLATSVAESMEGALEWDASVSRHLKQPTPGKPPTAHHDVWCCINPTDAPTKAHALQIALIIKGEGAELCFCLGSGQSSAESIDLKEATQAYKVVRSRLAHLPEPLLEGLREAIEGFSLRKSWRDPKTSDFAALADWLEYAASEEGAAASISRDITVEELDTGGTQISEDFVSLAERLTPLFDWVYREAVQPGAEGPLTVDAVKAAVGDLSIADEIYAALVAALESGKHVIVTGPPGTGKTTLAEGACQAAKLVGRTSDYVLTTATSDWTTYETIGGLRPTAETLEFREGHLLEAVRKDNWLLVDELNRAPFDQAFGQLFTVLSGQAVVLPYDDPTSGNRIAIVPPQTDPPAGTYPIKVSNSWRLVATMNVFDKDLLFEMSYALMRRFAFVEVPVPRDEVYEQLIDKNAGGDEVAASTAKALLAVRAVKEIGPASFIDMTRFLVHLHEIGGATQSNLVRQGFFGYLLPQFEGIDGDAGRDLFEILTSLLDPKDKVTMVQTLCDVLGLDREVLEAGTSPTLPEEEDD